jgi:hypothetical protein
MSSGLISFMNMFIFSQNYIYLLSELHLHQFLFLTAVSHFRVDNLCKAKKHIINNSTCQKNCSAFFTISILCTFVLVKAVLFFPRTSYKSQKDSSTSGIEQNFVCDSFLMYMGCIWLKSSPTYQLSSDLRFEGFHGATSQKTAVFRFKFPKKRNGTTCLHRLLLYSSKSIISIHIQHFTIKLVFNLRKNHCIWCGKKRH